MLMVAELFGVGWRIFDGAGWRRRHPCISIGFVHHHTVHVQRHTKRRGYLVVVHTLQCLQYYYNQLITLFIDIWQNHHGGELRSMYYMLQMGT